MTPNYSQTDNQDPLRLISSDYRSLADKVYEKLKEAILVGELKPGDQVSERELARRMGVSSTTIKNALYRLSLIGIVDIQPRKGTYVSESYLTSIEEITTIRASLEGLAAGFAAEKASVEEGARIREQIARMKRLTENNDYESLVRENTAFHDLINSLAKSPYIAELIDVVRSFDYTIRRRALTYPEEASRGFSEHHAVAEAIIAGDAQAAEELMKNHILRTLRYVLARETS